MLMLGDGSVVKNTGCSSGGYEFDSQQLHGSSQSSVTPVLGDNIWSLWETGTHMVYGYTYVQNNHTQKINFLKKNASSGKLIKNK